MEHNYSKGGDNIIYQHPFPPNKDHNNNNNNNDGVDDDKELFQ
jgi:hypothetical protein